MGNFWRLLAMPFGLGLIFVSGAAAAWSNLDRQLWTTIGTGGDVETVRSLLERGANPNTAGATDASVLMCAMKVEVARALLDRGAEINARDMEGKSALHYRTQEGTTKDTVELLLDRGAAVNARDKEGETPLANAAIKGRREVAELLIKRGAEVNSRDKSNSTPLHWAAYLGNTEVVKLLVGRGAEVNALTSEGLTVLSCTCVQDDEIVAVLKAAGATGTPVECSEETLMLR